MTRKLSDFVGRARKLESLLAERVEGATRNLTGSSPRQPLEIIHVIVDTIERELIPTGRAQRAFPFNRIRVLFVAPTARIKAHFTAICDGTPSLRDRIVLRLEGAGCVVSSLDVELSFVAKAKPDWSQAEFQLEYTRAAESLATRQPLAHLELTVTHGTSRESSYTFDSWPVALGRGDEVRDSRQRLLRTNHVAFAEGGGEINDTVSRQHARIEHDQLSGVFRLFDDGSAQGTSVIRKGRGHAVPRGSKGMRLQSGDEIVLGRARVHVKILT
jgi:FHA domain-containing protein